MLDKKRLYELIDARDKEFEAISDFVWEHPETCFMEKESTQCQLEQMKQEGFKITTPVAGMDTAFIAEFGSGRPIIGILGENDALPGQSQEADAVCQKAITPGGNGHACGHNLLGTGAMQAACGLKAFMQEKGISGTIRYILTPAEEGGGGKCFMARAHVFDDLDAILAWHPNSSNCIGNRSKACVTFNISYHGKAAHASAAPWDGIGALDAAELANTGLQYLRAHVTPDVRLNSAYVDAGGQAPNVIQSHTKVTYCLRADRQSTVEELYRKVLDIARGACLMTGATMDKPFTFNNYLDQVDNPTLDRVMLANMHEVYPLSFTDEEKRYAAQFVPYGSTPDAKEPIDTSVCDDLDIPAAGSSDVGDASYCAPTVQAFLVTEAAGTVAHSWCRTAQGKSSVAKKGMHAAAKVLAGTALDLLLDPELIKKARADYKKNMEGRTYSTLLPDSLKPGDHKY